MSALLPPLNSLKAFEAAARHVSIAKAAAELHVTPAAVSQQIKQLEDRLGAPLFHRMNRKLVLTDQGRMLLPGLSDGFGQLARAVEGVRRHIESGPLHVNVSPAFAAKWLLPRLDRFHARHPEIEVRVTAAMGLVDFHTETVDLAVRFGAGDYPGLASEFLLGDAVFPVCAPKLLAEGEHPLTCAAELRHHRLLHDGSPNIGVTVPDWRMWLRAAEVEGVDPNSGMTLTPWALVVQAAIEGQGVALGRAALLGDDVEKGRLVRPFKLALKVPFAHRLVYREGSLARAKLRAFRDWMLEETAAQRDADGLSQGGG
jgi:LysR family glycine cleavage system transcriptional activator